MLRIYQRLFKIKHILFLVRFNIFSLSKHKVRFEEFQICIDILR